MNYKLATKLKKAGFPQEFKKGDWICYHGIESTMEKTCDCYGDALYYYPTLSELIEACGDGFENLTLKNEKWLCNYFEDQEIVFESQDSEGSTPEEAVANLYLKLKS
jgi:hypothetical protein